MLHVCGMVSPYARADYGFLPAKRRSNLGLDQEPQHDKQNKKRRAPADYSGEACKYGGVQFSTNQQQSMVVLLEIAYDGRYYREQSIDLSPVDELAFQAHRSLHEASTYGEILPQGAFDMLWRVGAKPGDRFYDLGSGTGKVVMLAYLAGLRATGIELSHARWKASCKAASSARVLLDSDGNPAVDAPESLECPKNAASMDLLWASLLDVDFTDADVIFICSVVFSIELVHKLAATARWMKPGSRIVSYQPLDGSEFKEIGKFATPTSWSHGTLWTVQEVVANPSEELSWPHGVKRVQEFPSSQLYTLTDSISASCLG